MSTFGEQGDAVEDARLSAWLDDELDEQERAAIESMIAADHLRRDELAELAQTRLLVRDLGLQAPPAGFLESLLLDPGLLDPAGLRQAEFGQDSSVVDLDAHRRRTARRWTAGVAGMAAAAALVVAVVVPGVSPVRPALAADVRVHQAGVAASGDPVSGIAPLASPVRFGR